MRRREFVTSLSGAATIWPFAVRAQQSKLPLIGFLSGRSAAESSELVRAFQLGLAETGHVVERNVAVEFRWADGRYDRLAALATELVGGGVRVIAAVGGAVAGLAAKSVTSSIPIVFASGGD